MEERTASLSSIALDWKYNFSTNWQSSSEFQLDSAVGRISKLNLGLNYEDECIKIDLSASRRFSTSATLNDKTEFGLTIELLGFSSGVLKTPKTHQCGAL